MNGTLRFYAKHVNDVLFYCLCRVMQKDADSVLFHRSLLMQLLSLKEREREGGGGGGDRRADS